MNAPLKNSDLETLLSTEPAPAPPADLGERLKNDLAGHLAAGAKPAAAAPAAAPQPSLRLHDRRPELLKLAASFAVVAVGLAFAVFVWREKTLTARPYDGGVPAKPSLAKERSTRADSDHAVTPSYRQESPDASTSAAGATATVERDAASRGNPASLPPPPPTPELARRAPAPKPIAAQKTAAVEPGIADGVAGGIEGGVEGGVEGGIAGGVVGGVPGGVASGVAAPSEVPPQAEEPISVTGETPIYETRPAGAAATKPASRANAPEAKLKALGYLGGRVAKLEDEKRADERSRDWQGSGRYSNTEPARPSSPSTVSPSTGGTVEPNDQPVGDMFFRSAGTNPFVDTDDDRLSTFGLDVDTGSYTLARGYLDRDALPPAEAIRVEEFVNYFAYPERRVAGDDFTLHVEGGPTPFVQNDRYRLLRLHLQAREIDPRDRRPADLLFVVDVSGSMAREDRLELVKRALALLVRELEEDDRVGLVVFGSNARVLLEPTHDLDAIRRAVDRLVPEGSTNTEEGLRAAYDLADRTFRERAIHRLILCSDGVANVGATGPESILERIGKSARRGIELETVGFGMGNYNDALMEQLADQGDGHYAYVDTLEEAHRVFVENLNATLQTIARDAKVQVEFDPRTVERYRLIGYENRDVADRDFRNDRVDAGEIGAGHEVTALYELKLARGSRDLGRRDPVATVRLRYKATASGRVVETGWQVRGDDFESSYRATSRNFHLASTVAAFAETLKGTYWAQAIALDDVAREAAALARSGDFGREVDDLADLVRRASRLAPPAREPEE